MIDGKQEKFIRENVPEKYFYVEKLLKYLNVHDVVGGEVFEIVKKSGSVRTLSDECGYEPVKTDVFVRRSPYYFYVEEGEGRSFGAKKDLSATECERLYETLEKIASAGVAREHILSYPREQTGEEGRTDVLYRWAEYLSLMEKGGEKRPKDILFAYNTARERAGKDGEIFFPRRENCRREAGEFVVDGEFPFDGEEPVLRWIGVWTENVTYVKGERTPEGKMRVRFGLKPTTKIFLADDREGWTTTYVGPLEMKLSGEILRAKRKTMGLTQREAALGVGTLLRTYQNWEKGTTRPDGAFLLKLVNLLDISDLNDFIVNESFSDIGWQKFRARYAVPVSRTD